VEGDAIEEDEELHGLAEDGGGALVEVGSVADALGDDAHDLEDFEGLAEGRAADAKGFGEFALGGEARAGLEGALGDQLFEDGDEFDGDVFFAALRNRHTQC